MFSTIKTIGTILTVASTAQMGKEFYSKYKTKKREKQIKEVHDFLTNIDINQLESALQTKDNDALIDAIENIIRAAEIVKTKTEAEEIIDDVKDVAINVFDKVSSTVSKVGNVIKENIEETIYDENPKANTTSIYTFNIEKYISQPSFKKWKNATMPLVFIDSKNDTKVVSIKHNWAIVDEENKIIMDTKTNTLFYYPETN